MTYVIKIKDGYYREDSPYKPVPREQATRLARRDADRIKAGLRKLGYLPIRETA